LASCELPQLAERELTALPPCKIVNIDGSVLSALAAFQAGRDLQRYDLGEAVAIEIAMPEDAPPGPIHRLPALRTGFPDSGRRIRTNS
jgi:hypothetical protein